MGSQSRPPYSHCAPGEGYLRQAPAVGQTPPASSGASGGFFDPSPSLVYDGLDIRDGLIFEAVCFVAHFVRPNDLLADGLLQVKRDVRYPDDLGVLCG